MERQIPKMQSTLTKQAAKQQKNEVLALLSDDDACDFQSNGGTGAGAYLLLTPEDASCKLMPDAHFCTCIRDRLLLSVCSPNSTCQHRKADGSLCNTPLDSRGRHARKCKCQGLVDVRHNNLRDWAASSWYSCMNERVTKEQHVPAWDIINSRGETVEAILDVAATDPSTGIPLYFDVCVWTAHSLNPSTLHTRAQHPGRAAADAAASKHRRYARAGSVLQPLPLEAGGRPGEDFINFVRRCGAASEDEPEACSRLWFEASTILQRANAELILAANGT